MLFPMFKQPQQDTPNLPVPQRRFSIVTMVDGKPVERELTPTELVLAEQLHENVSALNAVYGAYKRSRLYLWASVGANVLMLFAHWAAYAS